MVEKKSELTNGKDYAELPDFLPKLGLSIAINSSYSSLAWYTHIYTLTPK